MCLLLSTRFIMCLVLDVPLGVSQQSIIEKYVAYALTFSVMEVEGDKKYENSLPEWRSYVFESVCAGTEAVC